MHHLILAAEKLVEVSGEELKSGWGSLVWTGLIILAAIVVFIWWLSRR